ncbi:TPA: hypothetical protein N0F65_000373 [Lagenidium giganteum]|uniref:Uncharacterized protein n=1 Tax=Lagenidium giganteum TaxID=4803 RepID=A0AAV2Z0B6_9STRA|nr:TPA: hypothetical protein N0F65_000373 [Lagenidium giganteum]
MTGLKFSLRKIFFFLLNAASTVLTLLTGLRENNAIVYITGRYDHIRERLQGGEVNYNHIIPDMVRADSLPDLHEVGNSYRFISAPERSYENLNEDRSTCMRINSMNTTLFTVDYDDMFGGGPRRTEVFLYSISAPKCEVINFSTEWYNNTCIHDIGGNKNETKCHEFIFDHFAELKADRLVHVGVLQDFGTPGVPFLKCRGRSGRQFVYITDLMNQQAYWAGGSYQVEIQSSHCYAVPKLRSSDWTWSLFKTEPVDTHAVVVVAVQDHSWLPRAISFVYGIVAITMIAFGTASMVLQTNIVRYIPRALRASGERRILRYLWPSMKLMVAMSHDDTDTVSFSGAMIIASSIWMNHWLYVGLSCIDAAINIRSTYLVMEMGTWMLRKKQNSENFIFLCSALTKVTWFACLVHTVLRYVAKVLLNAFKKAGILPTHVRDRLIWYVDGIALFMSYKFYSIWLCAILLLCQIICGSTTFMKRIDQATPEATEIASYWNCEIMFDYFTTVGLLTATGVLFGLLMLQTKYRAVVDNHFIRLLQDRYVFVGWDVFVATESLGLDPYAAEDKSVESVATCLFGCVLQQLFMSGPSGLVDFVGDAIFLESTVAPSVVEIRYPPAKAKAMGLCGRTKTKAHRKWSPASPTTAILPAQHFNHGVKKIKGHGKMEMRVGGFFSTHLRIHVESMWGRIIVVDQAKRGKFTCTAPGARATFVVQDALSKLEDAEITYLLGDKHIRIT